MKNQKGFSLVEMLLTVGLLTIVSTIAVVGYRAYVDDAERKSVGNAINKIQNAFQMCMTFSNNDLSKCNSFEKIKYTKPAGSGVSGKLTAGVQDGRDKTDGKICFVALIKDKDTQKGKKICFGYDNGTTKICVQSGGDTAGGRCKASDGRCKNTAASPCK